MDQGLYIVQILLQLIILIGGLYLVFFKSYFKEKGKNLATLEDIEQITEKVEGIKSEFNTDLEGIKAFLQRQNLAYEINLSELTKMRFQRIDTLYEDLVNLQSFVKLNMFSYEDDEDFISKKQKFIEYYNIADKSRYKCDLYISQDLKREIINVLDGAYQAYLAFIKYYNSDTNKIGNVSFFNLEKGELLKQLSKQNMDALEKLNNEVEKFPNLLTGIENEFKKHVTLKEIKQNNVIQLKS